MPVVVVVVAVVYRERELIVMLVLAVALVPVLVLVVGLSVRTRGVEIDGGITDGARSSSSDNVLQEGVIVGHCKDLLGFQRRRNRIVDLIAGVLFIIIIIYSLPGQIWLMHAFSSSSKILCCLSLI